MAPSHVYFPCSCASTARAVTWADRVAAAMVAFVDLLSEVMNGLFDAESVGTWRKLLPVAERRISVFALGFLDRHRILPMPIQELARSGRFAVIASNQ